MLADIKTTARKTLGHWADVLNQQADHMREQADSMRETVVTESERNVKQYLDMAKSYHKTLLEGAQQTWETMQSSQRQMADRVKENVKTAQETLENIHTAQREMADRMIRNVKTIQDSWAPRFNWRKNSHDQN